MGFYSSINLYYPLIEPPRLSLRDAALFCERFRTLGVVKPETSPGQASFTPGDRIDIDFADSDGWEEPTPAFPDGRQCEHPEGAWVFPHRTTIAWSERLETLKQMSDPAYRLFVSLGDLTDDLCNRLHVPSPENDQAFAPVSCSIEAGPVLIGPEDVVDDVWASSLFTIKFSGQGYCFPRTHREVIEQAKQQPEIQAVADLVRETWPIEPKKPPKRIIEHRKRMGDAFMGDPEEPLN